jgi:hypothetical protein
LSAPKKYSETKGSSPITRLSRGTCEEAVDVVDADFTASTGIVI